MLEGLWQRKITCGSAQPHLDFVNREYSLRSFSATSSTALPSKLRTIWRERVLLAAIQKAGGRLRPERGRAREAYADVVKLHCDRWLCR